MGIPTTEKKLKPPSQIQKILGWIYNTLTQSVSVPDDKIAKAIKQIHVILRRKWSHKKELEKLIGILIWMSAVIFPGKAFIRRFERHMCLAGKDYQSKIYLSEYALSDLRWWLKILKSGQLKSVPFDWLERDPSEADVVVKTDASSEVGIGGWSTEGWCFQVRLEDTIWNQVKLARPNLNPKSDDKDLRIQVLELTGALIAAEIGHKNWKGKCVTFFNDNSGASAAIIHKCSKLWRLDMNHLIREFCMLSATNRYYFWGVDIDGSVNERADALSRFSDFDTSAWDVVPYQRVVDIANSIFEKLIQAPQNMPH